MTERSGGTVGSTAGLAARIKYSLDCEEAILRIRTCRPDLAAEVLKAKSGELAVTSLQLSQREVLLSWVRMAAELKELPFED